MPSDLNLYMTSKCNFECSHCSRRVRKPAAKDVTIELVGEILDKFPITSVCLAGFGEPLITSNTIAIAQFLNKQGIKPSLITNGSMIMDYLEQLSDIDFLYLSVSLNEPNAELHEKSNGTKTFTKIIRGILELKARITYPVGISKVCFKGQLNNIPYFVNLGAYLGTVFIHLVNSLPYADSALDGILTYKDEEDIAFLEECKKDPQAIRVKRWPIPIGGKCPHTCDSPWKTIGVDGDGHITGCRRVFGPDEKFGHFSKPDEWSSNIELERLRNGIFGQGEYAATCNYCFGNFKKKKNENHSR